MKTGEKTPASIRYWKMLCGYNQLLCQLSYFDKNGRDGRIRTGGLLLPKQAR